MINNRLPLRRQAEGNECGANLLSDWRRLNSPPPLVNPPVPQPTHRNKGSRPNKVRCPKSLVNLTSDYCCHADERQMSWILYRWEKQCVCVQESKWVTFDRYNQAFHPESKSEISERLFFSFFLSIKVSLFRVEEFVKFGEKLAAHTKWLDGCKIHWYQLMITIGENFISPVLSLYTDMYFSYRGGRGIPGGEYTRVGDTRGYTRGWAYQGWDTRGRGIPGDEYTTDFRYHNKRMWDGSHFRLSNYTASEHLNFTFHISHLQAEKAFRL